MKNAPIPQRAARNPKTFFVTAQRDRIGRVGLEFDRIRAGFLGGAKNPDRLIEILIVIGGKLGNDVNGTAVSDLAACEFEGRRRLCFEQNLLPD